jgi:hypothetical protein
MRAAAGSARSWIALGALSVSLAGPAQAFDFTLGEDIKGSMITLITGGFSQRLRDQQAELIAAPGTAGFATGFQDAHTGDLNYNKGDLFALYVKGSHELLLTFPEQYKLFARTAWLLDGKAGSTEFYPLDSAARSQAAHDLRLYDLWVSKDFEMFGRASRLRLGRQVINWGESLFVAGGVNATAAIDLLRYTYPGVPLKEVVLPAEMVSWAVSPARGLNLETYYQFRWNANRLVPVGTYFSANDYIGEGKQTNWFSFYDPRYAAIHGGVRAISNPNFITFTGTPVGPRITNPGQALALANANDFTFCAVAALNPDGSCPLQVGSPYVGPDQTPSIGGQFGISAHYKPEGTSMDVGLYFERFHEKNPYVKYVLNPNLPLGYGQQLVYPQGHTLYGASVNFPLWLFAIGSEVSYRPKDPILVDPFSCSDFTPLPGGGANCNGNFATYRDAHKIQWNTTWWRAVNPSDTDWYAWLIRHAGAQQANIQGEMALIHYPGVSNHSYQGLGLLSDLSDQVYPLGTTAVGADKNVRHFGTADSIGIVQYLDMTFDGTVIPGWQLIPNITWSIGIAGDTPNENYTWFQGVLATTYALTFTQNLQHWSGSLLYVTYRGGSPMIERNFYADRDWWGASLTYTF